MMDKKDYIMKQILDFAKFIEKLLPLKAEKQYDVIVRKFDEFYLGNHFMDSAFFHSLSFKDILNLMRDHDNKFCPQKAINTAMIIKEEIIFYEEEPTLFPKFDLGISKIKSLSLIVEGYSQNKTLISKEVLADFQDFVEVVDHRQIDLKYLFQYYDMLGMYAKAEDILFIMKEHQHPATFIEGEGFYERLSKLEESELRMGNFSRQEVTEGKQDLLE